MATYDTAKINYDEALNTIWTMLAALLVFIMHAGFSMLEAGSVRARNTQNILTKNLVVVTVGFLCWYVLGWGLALGTPASPNKFIGGAGFLTVGFFDSPGDFKSWFFQGAFCATAGTIVSGAMAERTQLKGFAIFMVILTSIVYPVVVYWTWSGNGFLNYSEGDESKSIVGPAYSDFAGSGVVHLVGGVGALTGCIVVQERKDRWDGKSEEFDGHNVPFIVLGTFILWFGWYGFNAGSTGSMADAATAHTAGLVAVNTTLSPCVAGLVVFALRAFVCPPKCLDVGGFCNGVLAGLVSITAGCSTVAPWEAIIIGLVGGAIYQGSSMTVRKLKIDDVVDAFSVHGACGLWGVLALGFFGNPDLTGGNGLFYGGDQLGVQILACIFIVAWVLAWSLAVLVPLKLAKCLRLGDEIQDAGADEVEHSPPKAYST